MNIIILAGGLGTRLHPITKDLYPKCMIDVNRKPFLYHLLKRLVENHSIDKFILSVGHKRGHIITYFEDDFWGIPIKYCHEKKPLGTGGAIKFTLEAMHYGYKDTPFVVLNGDTFITIDLNKMMKFHNERKADITMAVKYVGDVSRFGHVTFDENKKMVEYVEKDIQAPGYVNAGVYIINETNRHRLPDEGSFEKDFLQFPAAGVYVFDEPFDFIDIGTPGGYEEFVRQKSEKKVV
ncbi:MAG: sugar phosphate nucleotidyltransferase [Promethearchaeota archaeon]|jgi:D-glycero-alpha-D-manno-heptose 1-phosphate guanylyltransferase